jgi:hypothetical protein
MRTWTFHLLLCLLAAAACALPASAAVYTLRGGVDAGDLASRLGTEEVLKDTVTINGHRGTLTAAVIAKGWEDAVAAVRPLLADASALDPAARQLLIETPAHDGWIIRHCLVWMGGDTHPVVFSITMPEACREKPDLRHWPRIVPRPAAVEPQEVMHLDRHRVDYVTFAAELDSYTLSARYDAALVAAGWQPAAEKEMPDGGGVYLKDSKWMLVFSTLDTVDGRTKAAIYVKRLHRGRFE